ncbi:SpoIIE family protein phosphatase [Antrihabitans sp. YC3-6]|uniref:SpoIIE family protein phosphatase n=1 Tax=Antrihabitans stalagmiti TaxID=2799499 RepID=A0A934NLW6_9NOCA|nr:SpoIIE family protein phosphatase [Antrihabitans stalagmiti]MBJ8337646.1 SpoIIE family protein phosphatase [Antrihabitans stalagmiti]
MSAVDVFRGEYRSALIEHLRLRTEASLVVGHELGRHALVDDVSLLDVTENHFRIVSELEQAPTKPPTDLAEVALRFLLQTLTALDVATRGFLEGTRRFEQQRARANKLADRDEFRRAVIDSLQDGFFVTDEAGSIVEVNSAFAAMTGYDSDHLPYPWPYPWLSRSAGSDGDFEPNFTIDALRNGTRLSVPITHSDGRKVWLAITTSPLEGVDGAGSIFVGTIRDITVERHAADREQAAIRLATAIAPATSVADVLTIGIRECRDGVGARRGLAVVWTDRFSDPAVYSATGESVNWSDLDAAERDILERARLQPALTAVSVPDADLPDTAHSISAAISGAADAALWLEYVAPQRSTAIDRALVTMMAGHLSLALQRARSYDIARETSLTLQRAMLGPIALPPGFAVRYEPATPPLEIGGDWYDVVVLPGERFGVIVGDCVGRGLAAAAVMGQLRSAANALMLRGAGPGQLLDELDDVAGRIPGAECTTVCAGIIDPIRGSFTYSSAGHMPALLAAPDVSGERLEGGRALPLASFDCSPRPETTVQLPTGSTLVVYTDGLVERRTESIDIGIDKVGEVLLELSRRAPDDVADAVLALLQPSEGYDDDVAMVIYRQPPLPMLIEVPAEGTQLGVLRARLRTWMDSCGVPEQVVVDSILAVNEAFSNSVEHAFRNVEPGRVTVTAVATVDELRFTVSDTGTWKEQAADPGYRGRGLPMMRALTDEVTIERSDAGTTVRMSTVLTGHPVSKHQPNAARQRDNDGVRR